MKKMFHLYEALTKRLKKTSISHILGPIRNYLSASVAARLVGFISIPVFTRVFEFSQEEYGYIALFTTYAGILAVVLPFNMHGAVNRFWYETGTDLKEFLGNTLLLVAAGLAVSGLVLFFFYDPILGYLNISEEIFLFSIALALCTIAGTTYSQILIANRQSKEFAIITTIQAYGDLILAIALIYFIQESRYMGRIWASVIAAGIMSTYVIFRLRNRVSFRIRVDYIRYILNFSLPMLPYLLSGTLLSYVDRIMIDQYEGTASTGLYSLGYNIAMIILVVSNAIRNAVMPDFFELQKQNKLEKLYSLMRKIILFNLGAAAGLILAGEELIYLLADPKFYESVVVIPGVVMGYVFFAFYYIYIFYTNYRKQTIYMSLIVIISGVLNIFLNAWAIPRYGFVAGAYTTVASYFVMFLTAWLVAVFGMKGDVFPIRNFLLPGFKFFLFLLGCYVLGKFDLNIWTRIPFKMILFASFALWLVFPTFKLTDLKSRI